jgi:EAL domain-containing protein (putative c-di-GMP-specific phosphodiesterase class I)
MARISDMGYPLELEVNVSARQVSDPEFALWVRQTLAHAEFPADMLGLAITETALIRPHTVTSRNLNELDSLGVRIVLEHFGTGSSSLSWLKQHPFGAIKIDRSFISDLPANDGDRAIVAGVIDIARALGCIVTAEGVETAQQLAALQSLGCGRVQGFELAGPVSAEGLIALLEHRPPLDGHGPGLTRRIAAA